MTYEDRAMAKILVNRAVTRLAQAVGEGKPMDVLAVIVSTRENVRRLMAGDEPERMYQLLLDFDDAVEAATGVRPPEAPDPSTG